MHLAEVTHFHIETSIGTSLFMVFTAKHTYEALPPAIRKAIDDNSGEARSDQAGDRRLDRCASRRRGAELVLARDSG